MKRGRRPTHGGVGREEKSNYLKGVDFKQGLKE